MLFPFIRDFFSPRNVVSAPNGWYKPIRSTGDNNAVNAFEATQGPPYLDVAARGNMVGQGPGIQGAFFMPVLEIPSAPTVGLLQTANYIGGGPLFTTDNSSPETELF